MGERKKSRLLERIMSGKSGLAIVIIICTVALTAAALSVLVAHNYISSLETENQATVTESETEPEQTDSETETETETQTETVTETQTETVTETESETDPPDDPTIVWASEPEDKIVICIDPGHGFFDSGAVSTIFPNLYEKDLNLAISLKVENYIKEHASSEKPVEVYLSRRSDEDTSLARYVGNGNYLFGLEDRRSFIRSLGGCNAVVSIHCNQIAGFEEIDGIVSFYAENHDKYLSAELCTNITDYFKILIGDSPSGREPQLQMTPDNDSFFMTKCSPYPSVLVECGYLSNLNDATALQTEEYQNKIAEAIAKGIMLTLDISY